MPSIPLGPPARSAPGTWLPRARAALGLLLCAGVLLATTASAEPSPPRAPGLRAAPAASAGEAFDRRMNALRATLAGGALVVWLAELRARRRGTRDRARARAIALGLIAATAFATNYNFFLWRGLHRHELYHYYLGSKYFPELGYSGLYRCSVAALRARGEPVAARVEQITDLRVKQLRSAAEILADAESCQASFSPERWTAFQDDVTRFLRWMGEERWLGVLVDHGYNPSPVWTLMGRPIAERIPSDVPGLWRIAALDLWVLGAGFLALAWGFGFPAACLSVIAWGANGLNFYGWTGDAFLRQVWFAALLAGLACSRRGRPVVAGALLAFSALLRVFPVMIFAGLGLRELRRLASERRVRPEVLRLAAGAALASALLFAGSLQVSGRGVEAWREFANNLSAQASITPQNAVGLSYLMAFTTAAPPPEVIASAQSRQEAIEANKRLTLSQRRPLQLALLALFGVLFWSVTRPAAPGEPERLEDWEALALGVLALPFVALPFSYYIGFVAVGAPLATRRPRIGVALLATTFVFAASLWVYPNGARGYVAASLALLGFCVWTLLELRRPAQTDA